MAHKSKEAIKTRMSLLVLPSSLLLVLRIRRVEHAIKIPIAVCTPTQGRCGEKEGVWERTTERVRY